MTKLLAAVGLFSAFATAWAESVDMAAKFCADPIEAICGPGGRDAKQRALHLEADVGHADRLALAVVKTKFPQFKRRGLTLEDLKKIKDKSLRHRAVTAYYETELAAIQRHLGSSHLASELHFARIKKRLETVISQHNAIDRKEAKDMLKNIHDAELVDAVEVLQGKKGGKELREAVIASCNRNGLVENASAENVANKHYVIVCPGDYLGGMERSERNLPASELLAANEVWTLGHETGHHIDSGEHPASYQLFRQCVAANHSQELKKPVDDYMEEISADHWGEEELASYLVVKDGKGQPLFDTPEKKFNVIKRSLISLCDTEDDGVHPKGQFRIEMARRNPRIHNAIKCVAPDQSQARAEDASCTLSGKGPLTLWSKLETQPRPPALASERSGAAR